MRTVLFLLLLLVAATACRRSDSSAPESPPDPAAEHASPAAVSQAAAPGANARDPGKDTDAATKKAEAVSPNGLREDASAHPRNKPPVTGVISSGNPLRPPPPNVAEYNFLGGLGIRQGPPSPPVGSWETKAAADLLEWTEVPLHDKFEQEGPGRFKTYMDAATDPAAVSHAGQVIFELARSNELEPIQARAAQELEYTDLLRLMGKTSTLGAYAEFRERIAGQVAALGPDYGEFVDVRARKDRILGMLFETEMARLARWTFEYKDKAGATRTACYLFLLVNFNWLLLDMDCGSGPFGSL